MSWCRWSGKCDLYIYESSEGFVCESCDSMPDDDNGGRLNRVFATPREMVKHIKWHAGRGDSVPPELLTDEFALSIETHDENGLPR